MLNIRLFASLRDLAHASHLTRDWVEGMTVESLFEDLVREYPRLSSYRANLLTAVNEEYSQWDRPLKDGDEIAFFPPVSGGNS